MSYVALARKYRPKNFSELLGQDILTTTLTNAINNNRVHHAYLFTGTRGVGKTTVARILAKNLNCIGGGGKGEATVHPCEKCTNCVSISNGSSPDVIEFDAASNTGVEDIKVIISNAHYAPVVGRKKVFIIDEVHMISTKAFNALLKTLEEPPENTIFIFATTEIRKVPITILSRCQKFFLKALKKEVIMEGLRQILIKEGFDGSPETLELIATKAMGSMRDALSILDQAILNTELNEGERVISFLKVKEMLQIPSKEETEKLLGMILDGNVAESLSLGQDLISSGLEELEIISDLIEVVSIRIKQKLVSDTLDSMPILIRFYQILLKSLEEIKLAENRGLSFEVALIKLCYSVSIPSPAEIIERLKNNDVNIVLNSFDGAKLIE